MQAQSGAVLAQKRDYVKLLQAMSGVVRALRDDGCSVEQALHRSFQSAVDGFQAQRALLLLVEEEGDPPRLRALQSRGLAAEQISACETGTSVRGVSAKLIRAVVRDRELKVVENPFFLSAADQTQAFEATRGENYSAIAAPVRDALNRVRAVIYLSNVSLDPLEAYGQQDGEWLAEYTEAVGHVFSFYFDQELREEEIRRLRSLRGDDAPELVGESAATQGLLRVLHEVYIPMAGTREPDPLLLLGEMGTGKDLVAKYVHAYSARAEKPFVVVNCGDITDELAASRFFGHVKGAFTGADQATPGFFRAANGGVLFLDEIAELSPRGQATLLRAIDSWTVTPVGDTREHKVDVLVILATNRDLEQLVRSGGMREDFYRRFNTHSVRLTPLRERPWDIPPLVAHFLRHHERRAAKKILGLSQDALRAMVFYPWPGNVREVKKVCSKLITHAKVGERIDRQTLFRLHPEIESAQRGEQAEGLLASARFREATAEFQRELIRQRLEAFERDVRAARESLGLTKSTFRRKLIHLRLTDLVAAKEERD